MKAKPAPKTRKPRRSTPAEWLEARRRNARAVLEAGCYRPRTEATAAEESRVRKLKPKAAAVALQATNAAMSAPLTKDERADLGTVEKATGALLNDPADASAWVALAEALLRLRYSWCARRWAGARAVAGHAEALGVYREVLCPDRLTAERRVQCSDRAILDRLATEREKHGRTAWAAEETARSLEISRATVYRTEKRDTGTAPVA